MILSLPTRRIWPTNFESAFTKLKTETVLSQDEKEFLSKVMDVPAKDAIGWAIQCAMSDFTIDGFRELVTTLLSQGDDNPRVMREILGVDCFVSLQKLRS